MQKYVMKRTGGMHATLCNPVFSFAFTICLIVLFLTQLYFYRRREKMRNDAALKRASGGRDRPNKAVLASDANAELQTNIQVLPSTLTYKCLLKK